MLSNVEDWTDGSLVYMVEEVLVVVTVIGLVSLVDVVEVVSTLLGSIT